MNLTANNIVDECYEQYSFFVDPQVMENDRKITKSVNDLKTKFGNNAILKGMDLLDAATQQERNRQIGGHKSGE
jgi:DNA polymerase V